MRVWPDNKLGNRKEQQWTKLQYDLENISNNSSHFFAFRSGHAIHLDEPKLVADKILLVIKRSRNNIIKNKITKMLTDNLPVYQITSSINLLSKKRNIIIGSNKKDRIKKYLPVIKWLDNNSLAQQFEIRKVNISNDFLYIK